MLFRTFLFTFFLVQLSFSGITQQTEFATKKVVLVILDVFPTVASYLDIPIPRNHAMELDGVDMWGKV
jgi:hypothetical protein